jgi:hypothetical protein
MPSPFGLGPYGKGLYSSSSVYNFAGAIAPVVTFAADLSLQGLQDLAGSFVPSVTLAGNLIGVQPLVGDLAPQINFAGHLDMDFALVGDLAPRVTPLATIMGDKPLNSDMSFQVAMAASMTFGPFWTPPDPCPPTTWVPATCETV